MSRGALEDLAVLLYNGRCLLDIDSPALLEALEDLLLGWAGTGSGRLQLCIVCSLGVVVP